MKPAPDSRVKRFLDGYHRLLRAVLTALMALMIVPIGLQIVSRYTHVIPRFIWTEEVARFCFVWIIMIGSMLAVRDGTHFDVDLLPPPKTPRGRACAGLVVHAGMMVMALAFVWYGGDFARSGFRQTSEMSGINLASIYVAFPLAGLTWAVFLLEKIVAEVRRLAAAAPDPAA